jgi:hypothetical protein
MADATGDQFWLREVLENWREFLDYRDVSLLGWALGSFHAAALLVVALLALHLNDSLAGAIREGGTLVGGALYLVLLGSTVLTARLVVDQAGLDDPGALRGGLRETLRLVGWGTLGGAVNGVLFLLALSVVGFVALLVVQPGSAPIVLLVLAFGGVAAAVAGLLLGFVFVLVDLLLLWAALALLPEEAAPGATVDTRPDQ